MRELAAAAGHGFYRSVSDPPLGPEDAHRGNARSAGFAGAGGESALPGSEQHGGLAALEGALYGQGKSMAPVLLDAEPLQPDLPRGRTRSNPAVHGSGIGVDPLESSGARLSDGHAEAWRRRYQTLRSRYICEGHVLQSG